MAWMTWSYDFPGQPNFCTSATKCAEIMPVLLKGKRQFTPIRKLGSYRQRPSVQGHVEEVAEHDARPCVTPNGVSDYSVYYMKSSMACWYDSYGMGKNMSRNLTARHSISAAEESPHSSMENIISEVQWYLSLGLWEAFSAPYISPQNAHFRSLGLDDWISLSCAYVACAGS